MTLLFSPWADLSEGRRDPIPFGGTDCEGIRSIVLVEVFDRTRLGLNGLGVSVPVPASESESLEIEGRLWFVDRSSSFSVETGVDTDLRGVPLPFSDPNCPCPFAAVGRCRLSTEGEVSPEDGRGVWTGELGAGELGAIASYLDIPDMRAVRYRYYKQIRVNTQSYTREVRVY